MRCLLTIIVSLVNYTFWVIDEAIDDTVGDFAEVYIKVVIRKWFKNIIGSKSSNEFFSKLKATGYATGSPSYLNDGV
ncbi:hypothetical protein BHC46_04995 [Snodgrassella alvi]|jgi:hypothetical protein|uniref:Uncharacterized protein n=1 Tax=Snodgrassella alvi TaxID=1196083 RepID=A0A2N9XH58_9NEIS|nr:hypothetical protein BHC46_04995 [Snodgrassella alvi]